MEIVQSFPGVEGMRRFRTWLHDTQDIVRGAQNATRGGMNGRRDRRARQKRARPSDGRNGGRSTKRRRDPGASAGVGSGGESDGSEASDGSWSGGSGEEEEGTAGDGGEGVESESKGEGVDGVRGGGTSDGGQNPESISVDDAVAAFTERHPTARLRWEAEPGFPSDEVVHSYLQPAVDSSAMRLRWGEPGACTGRANVDVWWPTLTRP